MTTHSPVPWFKRQRQETRDPLPGQPLVPARITPGAVQAVNGSTVLRHSAVWAALRLRAEMISHLPLGVYRQVGALRVQLSTPPVLVKPGPSQRLMEWLFSSQMDLDRFGNAFGLIRARDGFGIPSVIELIPADQVTVKWSAGSPPTYTYQRQTYSEAEIWHERQYTVPGTPIGLSPVAYAALTVSQYISAQQFALDWYSGSSLPSAVLTNTERSLLPDEAYEIKQRFKASVKAGEPMIADKEWTLQPFAGAAHDTDWLNTMDSSSVQVARFFGVPSDLIDAFYTTGRSSITYANITQRNLQFLIMNLGPLIARREDAISAGLLPARQMACFDTESLLRMDPDTSSAMYAGQVAAHLRAPSEVRALWNLPPFTPEQLAEFAALAPAAPMVQGVPA